jgi:multidrug efflux pump subunit AcrB
MAVVLIYIILGIQFNSPFQPIIVMVTLPLAFIGVAYGLFISGMDLSLLALISLVALAGIVVNDSIILVDFINNVSDNKNRRESLIESGSKRLRPILLTTVTTVGGLMPMAVFATGSNKMWQPMAVTMIWGIMFATTLTLFVIPVLYAITDDIIGLFSRKKKKTS